MIIDTLVPRQLGREQLLWEVLRLVTLYVRIPSRKPVVPFADFEYIYSEHSGNDRPTL
jgi:hypothetical protein